MVVTDGQIKELSIYELAEQIEVGVTTLKTWESFFNIPVGRNAKNARKYSEDNVIIFREIKKLSSNGFSLNSIKSLINQLADAGSDQQQKIEIITESLPEQEQNFSPAIVNKYELKITVLSRENSNLNRELGRLEGQLSKFNEIIALKDSQIQERNNQIQEYKEILDELEAGSSHKWWQFWK